MKKKTTNIYNPIWLQQKDAFIANDESFERPYGCWNKKKKQQFILSVLGDDISCAFTIASVSKCKDYSTEMGDKPSESWFAQELNKNVEFTSIDGKHRRETIIQFMQDEFPVTGVYLNSSSEYVKLKNTRYSELSPEQKSDFDSCELIFVTLQKHTRSDLAQEFVRINSQAKMTDQHLRNATDSSCSSWSRQIVRTYSGIRYIYSEAATANMKPEEDVSKILMHCRDEGCRISKDSLDAFYYEGEKEGQSGSVAKSYSPAVVRTAMAVFDTLNGLDLKQSDVLLFAMVAKRVYENKYRIINYDLFREEIRNADCEEKVASMAAYSKTRSRKAIPAHYYFEWATKNWGQMRQKRINQLWDDKIAKNPGRFGLEPLTQTATLTPAASHATA